MTEQVPAQALGHGALMQATPRGALDEDARLAVAGVAQAQPNWDGVILVPGDPSHWVHLSAGEIVSFQSFLTQRLATALGAGETANADAVEDSMARPERLATQLNSAALDENKDAILGHLIGAELAAARSYWLGQQVIVLGDGPLADTYATVLEAQGTPVTRGDRQASETAARKALAH